MRLARLTVSALAAATALLTMTAGPAAAATETDTVRPGRVGVDWHPGDTRPGGTATFADTYGGGAGTSSALVLSTQSPSAKTQMLTDAWNGTPLADITALGYETYLDQPSGTGVALPALNLRVDVDGNGSADRYLVFEPYQQAYRNATIQHEVWQRWDALDGGAARWWFSGGGPCDADHPCTWADITSAVYPDARIREGLDRPGSLGFNQGSGNDGLVAAADMLQVATAERDVTYDFETDVVLSGKDECKDGGWATSTLPVFRNQGDCVSHFASKKKFGR